MKINFKYFNKKVIAGVWETINSGPWGCNKTEYEFNIYDDTKVIREFNRYKKSKTPKILNYPSYSYIEWEEVASYRDEDRDLTDFDIESAGYISESNSIYWYSEKYLYRLSNHWGYVASCYWPIDGEEDSPNWIERLGRVKWEDIKWIPYKYRNPFYLFREQPEWIKDMLVKKGHVTPVYDCGELDFYKINRDYKNLNRIINWLNS